jgi:hypothetical protein
MFCDKCHTDTQHLITICSSLRTGIFYLRCICGNNLCDEVKKFSCDASYLAELAARNENDPPNEDGM